ncbi:MAG: hypothetical protein PHU66_01380 [Bacteroidaceae bacterium]|nr:hypothetical protein [Bacteroidaceae bacterium]
MDSFSIKNLGYNKFGWASHQSGIANLNTSITFPIFKQHRFGL